MSVVDLDKGGSKRVWVNLYFGPTIGWKRLPTDELDVVSPTNFGAVGDGVTDDTDAIQRCFDFASQYLKDVFFQGGIYLVRPRSTKYFSMSLRPSSTSDIYIAVLLRSNIHVTGDGATIVMAKPTGVSLTDTTPCYMFGPEELFTTIGDLNNISFRGVTFDFTEAVWGSASSSNPRKAFLWLSAKYVRLIDCFFTSSGASVNNTYGALCNDWINCQYVWITDNRVYNVQQFCWVIFCQYFIINGLQAEAFIECIDFDSICWNVLVNDCNFFNGWPEGGHEAQAIDWYCTDSIASNITAQQVNEIFTGYGKVVSYPNFTEWLARSASGTPPSVVTMPDRWKLINVTGLNVGIWASDKVPIQVTVVSATADTGLSTPTDVEVENVTLKNTGPVRCYGGQRIRFRNIVLDTVSNMGTNIDTGAAFMYSARPTDETISGLVENIFIKNSQGHGFRSEAPANVEFRNIKVDGYNLQQNANTRFGIYISHIANGLTGAFLGLQGLKAINGDPTSVGTDFVLNDATTHGSNLPTILDHGGHSFLSAAPQNNLSGSGTQPFYKLQRRATAVFVVDVSSATGVASLNIPISAASEGNAIAVFSLELINTAAIAGDASNYTNVTMQKVAAGSASPIGSTVAYGNAAIGSNTMTSIYSGIDADGILAANGNTLRINFARVGTGVNLGNLIARLAIFTFTAPGTDA